MLDLTQDEYQKLVLMLGSKKALGTYLGLDTKQTDELWRTKNLKSPLTWLRDQPRIEQLERLAAAGSLKKLAEKIGCSESALRPIYMKEPVRELNWEEDFLLAQFEKYRSVRLIAHLFDVNESLIRKEVERHDLELTELIDYSFGANSNSKGRRAELEYAKYRGDKIIADKNLTHGSQAEYDFDDRLLGRVNVKSSRRYRYRAKTRRGSPEFWKFSASGRSTTDVFVFMCYDHQMKDLVGFYVIDAKAAGMSKTITITAREMLPVAKMAEWDRAVASTMPTEAEGSAPEA